jgi:hypothetical protein
MPRQIGSLETLENSCLQSIWPDLRSCRQPQALRGSVNLQSAVKKVHVLPLAELLPDTGYGGIARLGVEGA